MAFYSYDMLRTFQVVAVNLSMTAAASQLNQSKGSVSYQIKKLESQLGFALFKRLNARLHLTPDGQQLLQVSKVSLDQIDQEIESLRNKKSLLPLLLLYRRTSSVAGYPHASCVLPLHILKSDFVLSL